MNQTLRQRSSTGGNSVCRQYLLNAIIADPLLSANKKINVIYILTDTLGRRYIGGYGAAALEAGECRATGFQQESCSSLYSRGNARSKPMPNVFSYTRAGHRGENQDAFKFRSHPRDPEVLLCALADGQGGHRGAAEAAKRACDVGIDAAACHSTRELLSRDIWIDILKRADHAVARDPVAGFTTLVAFCVLAERVVGGSCGDSAAILIGSRSEGTILTARQPKNPSIGSGRARFGCFKAAFSQPWVLLAVSDGVWKYTGWEPLLEITHEQSGEQTVTALRRGQMATHGPPQDDFTILMVAE